MNANVPAPVQTDLVLPGPATIAATVAPLLTAATSLVEQAERAEINSKESFDKSADFLKIVKTAVRSKDEQLDQLVKPLSDHVAYVKQTFKEVATLLDRADSLVRSKATKWWQAEQERQRIEAEAARKKRDDEMLAAAAQLEQAGMGKAAESLVTVAAETKQEAVKVTGRGGMTGASVGGREVFVAEVVDVKAVCRAIAAGDVPESIIKEFSKSALNAFAAQQMLVNVTKFGIKFEKRASLSVR